MQPKTGMVLSFFFDSPVNILVVIRFFSFNPPASSVQVPASARTCPHQDLLLLAKELSQLNTPRSSEKQAVVAGEL